jgi:clarin
VHSEAKYDDASITTRNSEVTYGLFAGKLQRYFFTSQSNLDLTSKHRIPDIPTTHFRFFSVTCSYSDNKCFYSCQQTDEARADEYLRLMNDESLASCPLSTGKMQQFNEQVNVKTNEIRGKSTVFEKEFLSAGLWMSTVVFLSITLAFTAVSGGFSVFNIFCSPAQFLFSAFGLYVWNGIAAGLCSLTMIFWGSLFAIFITNNIGITDTLTTIGHYSSDDLASLGFSFWILLVPIALHLTNIGLVYYRNFLLQKEPRAPVITVSKNDSTILVY